MMLKQGKISAKVVKEFDKASKGMNLPMRVGKLECPTCGGKGTV